MNLQEQTNRIKQMMGVIHEGNLENTTKKMVDKFGIKFTLETLGYTAVEPYLKVIDKVNFIKDKISEIDKGGFGLIEIGERPIFYDEEGDEIREIHYLGRDRAYILTFHHNVPINEIRVKYESLPVQVIEELVEVLLNH